MQLNQKLRTNCFVLSVLLASVWAVTEVGCTAENKLIVASPSFSEGGDIPIRFTCDGRNISPELNWSGAPENTKSFVLICDDPDAPAGTWVHWIIFNIAASRHSLAGNIPKQGTSAEWVQGRNDFGKPGYGGPCPPPGKAHRYYFRLYALDKLLDLKPGATRSQVDAAMKGHILARGKLMGRYTRQK